MNIDNALALIDKVCGMVALTREDHIRVAQAIEFIKQSLSPPTQSSDEN